MTRLTRRHRSFYATLSAATCLLAVCTFELAASEVKRATVDFLGSAYHYEFIVSVAAPVDAVRRIVTAYDAMERINNDIVVSEILERYDDGRLKRRMWIKHCLLVFCFDLHLVEIVEDLPDGVIKTTVVPDESNFLSGISYWRIEAIDSAHTRVSLDAEQEPDFWIPPIIGPLILKRAFANEVRETAVNIEREARRVVAE